MKRKEFSDSSTVPGKAGLLHVNWSHSKSNN